VKKYLSTALIVGSVAVCVQGFHCLLAQEKPATKSPAVVKFEQLGTVRIRTSYPINGFPTLIFTNTHGKVLLKTVVGDDRLSRINPELNHDGTQSPEENPILRFLVADGPAAKSKVVLAIAMLGGGSDCAYQGAVVGEYQGQLRSLLPKQVFTNAEGGMYLGDLGGNRGYGFAVWNFIWGSEDHMHPHRYNVKLFRFDPAAGQMVKIADLNTKRKYDNDTDALAELGLHFPNLLRSISDFGC